MAKIEPKYFIGKYTLKEYCLLHNYSYSSARNMISSNRKRHPEWSTDEILEDVTKRLAVPRTKYYFDGMTLFKYCKKHKIIRSTVMRIYQRLTDTLGDEFTDEEIMAKAVELAKRGREKYRVDDEKLSSYCERNDINKGSIISSISVYRRKHPECKLSDDEIAKEVLGHYRPGFSTYYVGTETLVNYVLRQGYEPDSVRHKLFILHPEIKTGERKICIEEAYVQEAMQSLKPNNGTLYFYGDTTLRDFCFKNGLNYYSVFDTMTKKPDQSLDDIIAKAFANKAKMMRQKDRVLLKERESDEEYVGEYIEKYGIDKEQYEKLKEHFGPFASISAIEYFCSVDDGLIEKIKAALSNFDKSLDDAIVLNNLGYHENAYYVVERVRGLIINVIKDVATDGKRYRDYLEFLEEYIYTILVDKCYMFTPGGFINYLKKTLKHKLVKHLKEECFMSNELDYRTIHVEDEPDRQEKNAMVHRALACLSEWELSFIYRRYGFRGEAMSIGELQEQFYSEFSVEELKSVEISLLEKLKSSSVLKDFHI